MKALSWQRGLTVAGAGIVLSIVCGLPLLAVFLQAGRSLLVNAFELFTPRVAVLFGGSLVLALEVTALSLLLGVPLGVLLGRFRLPAGRVLLALHTLPVFLPPFLLALGWFHIFGRQGLLGSDATSTWFFSQPGLVLVLVAALGPFVTLSTVLGIRRVDQALVDAARLVASPFTVVVRVLLPLSWPVIAVGALLVFVLAFAEVAVPMFLRVDVYPRAVFARLGSLAYAPEEAAVLALPVVLLAAGVVALERWITRRQFGILASVGARRELFTLGWISGPAVCLVLLSLALSWLPIVGLGFSAISGNGFIDAFSRLGETLYSSLLVAGLAATLAAVLALTLGHGVARSFGPARWLDAIALAAFFTPAAVSGIGAISIWNHPATGWIYNSLAVLTICLLGRYGTVAIRVFAAGVRQTPTTHEDAATTCGAGYLKRLTSVVAPENWRALIAAWFLVAVFCLRDVETAILIYPPGGETLSVRIFTLEANGPVASVAALSLIHVGLTALVLVAVVALVYRGEVLRWRNR